jgi:hypothetical protein
VPRSEATFAREDALLVVSPEAIASLSGLRFKQGYQRLACEHAATARLPKIFLKVISETQQAALCRKCRNKKVGQLKLVDIDANAEATDAIDFDMKALTEGEPAPEGWEVITLTAEDLPEGWPPEKPYPCKCGCGYTVRIGDRVAIRNVKKIGGYFVRDI